MTRAPGLATDYAGKPGAGPSVQVAMPTKTTGDFLVPPFPKRVSVPRRSVLSPVEWENLLAVPVGEEDLVRVYTFKLESALIGMRRSAANRLEFAVQLASMRHPGVALGMDVPERTVGDVLAEVRNPASSRISRNTSCPPPYFDSRLCHSSPIEPDCDA